MQQPQRLGDDFAFASAELQHAPPAWKFCAARSQERFYRENAQRANQAKMNGRHAFLIAGSGNPRHENIARQPGSRPRKKTSARGRNRARDHLQGPRGSGSAPRLPSWSCAGTAGCPAASTTPQEAVLLPPRPATRVGQQVIFEPASLSQDHERPSSSRHGDVVLCHARRGAGRKRGRWGGPAAPTAHARARGPART